MFSRIMAKIGYSTKRSRTYAKPPHKRAGAWDYGALDEAHESLASTFGRHFPSYPYLAMMGQGRVPGNQSHGPMNTCPNTIGLKYLGALYPWSVEMPSWTHFDVLATVFL
jgi:hypothetical protein